VNTAANIVVRWVVALGLALAFAATAVMWTPWRSSEPAWLPKPAHGRGDKCVAATEWMRRNHPAVLMHQRAATVHAGIRTQRFRLKGCINCHAVKGADGQPVTFASPRHFCRTCHDYAAVRIDCFECHASRPAPGAATANVGLDGREATAVAALAQYARSLGQ
jgi:[DsrC]-trisulfide reductase subunit J